MVYGVVYVITNQVNGKKYVGQTINQKPLKYCANHLKLAFHEKDGREKILYRAIRKYGPDAFSYSIICYADNQENLDEAEDYYILEYNTLSPAGYNVRRGGARGSHHPMTIERMKEASAKSEVRTAKSVAAHRRWSRKGERDRASKMMIDGWADPEIRDRRVAGLIESAKDPDVLRRRGQAIRDALATPEAHAIKVQRGKEVMSRLSVVETIRQKTIARNAKPEFKELFRVTTTNSWQDPKVREARSQGIKIAWDAPGRREAHGLAVGSRMQELWSDLEWASRQVEKQNDPEVNSKRSASLKKTYKDDPTIIERVAEASRRAWADPISRAKRLENMAKAMARPEFGKAISERIRELRWFCTPEGHTYRARESRNENDIPGRRR
jgi:hypothetical protein